MKIELEKTNPRAAVLSLNRPERRNALTIEMMNQLCSNLEELSTDPDVRVVILRGSGPVFCAGLDLHEALAEGSAEELAEVVAETFRLLSENPKVTIAAAHGAAIGGGAGLLMACDLSLGSTDLRVGLPEVRRGLVAGVVMAYLHRRVTGSVARELLLTGQTVNASRALDIGLINRVVPTEELFQEALGMADAVSKGAPEAIRLTKEFLSKVSSLTFEKSLKDALELHKRLRLGSEALEGIRAFVEKREPDWTK
jgi:methylglutaconyl-CoA hydratase